VSDILSRYQQLKSKVMLFTTNINGNSIEIEILNKLSVSNFLSLLNVKINGQKYEVTHDDFIFSSNGVFVENQINVSNGHFSLKNGMIFSLEDSLNLQEFYLNWEKSILDNKNSVLFKIPENRNDLSGGIPQSNPFFHAVLNKIARKYEIQPYKLGSYLSEKETKFCYQYVAFHPSSLNLVISRLDLSNIKKRAPITTDMFELIMNQALKHVSGYRDNLRYAEFAKMNNLHFKKEYKFLVEYEHILDADLKSEKIDFQYREAVGGFLDIFTK
jgi:hypothetical protein